MATLQHVGLRDQILSDMPGINEPMGATLLGVTDEVPHRVRNDGSEQLPRQLLTMAAPAHAAALLTMLGHICW